jgi:FkbM family methyltransferase
MPKLYNYDFIEIGTSDFNTLIQKADDTTKGLSIEPMEEYLSRLPDKKNITKVNGAISNKSGSLNIFFIPDNIRKDYNLPSWIKGTNSIGEPHKTVVSYLKKHNLPLTLIHSKKVPVYSISKLFSKYNVGGIEYLKIDTEGHDTIIMNAYLEVIKNKPSLLAKKILFESNSLSDKNAVIKIKESLENIGYKVTSGRQDTTAILIG